MCVYTLLGCPHDATTLSRLTMIGALARANCAGARANICNCVIAIYESVLYRWGRKITGYPKESRFAVTNSAGIGLLSAVHFDKIWRMEDFFKC